jgi:uncharacterized protein (TIGR02145 family)
MKHLTTLFAIVLSGTLLAQSEFCGIGTVWDAESQTCIGIEILCEPTADLDQDGVVGINDLLLILSAFGDFDLDFDGIYDSVDDCVGAYDECGICNGPGPLLLAIESIEITYDSIYVEAIDDWVPFVLESDTTFTYVCENPGCMDPAADNYDPYAVEEDGSCLYAGGSPTCNFQSAIAHHGYSYDLVAVNEQCWFAENLQTHIYNNGDSIAFSLGQNINNDNSPDYYYDLETIESVGCYYNLSALTDARGVCPNGFHFATESDWEVLFGGEAMLSDSLLREDYGGTNEFGLSLTAAGHNNYIVGDGWTGEGIGFYRIPDPCTGNVKHLRFAIGQNSVNHCYGGLYGYVQMSARCIMD